MEHYLIDWLSLIFRWLHLITGVAWIGASFYFIWLDNSLQNPPEWKKALGIKGDLWAIHGGGIYEVAKYQLAPPQMPETLHWFKWEAYTTWLTGMVLLTLIYYLGADAYLIDKRVADLAAWQAIAIGIGLLAGSWLLYELACASPLAERGYAFGVLLMLAGVAIAYGLTHLFSGRGAYIHFGAILGTLMVGNVFRVIIPSQKALVAAITEGTAPDPSWSAKAKLRSTHNTYLTLPVLFIMISNHYPMTYAHTHNWLILLVIVAITAVARQYFILRHRAINRPLILIGCALATLLLAVAIAPRSSIPQKTSATDPQQLTQQAEQIINERCVSCHSASPSDDIFRVAPGGVTLDNRAEMRQWSARIKARTVDSNDMPFLNKTNMTETERAVLAQWLDSL